MPSQDLRPAERITRRRDFQQIYQRGTRSGGRFMTVFTLLNGGPVMRLGVAATRKLGGAVVRNRAKRLARELFRRNKVRMGLDVVVVPRREMLDADFGSLEADYCALLRRRINREAAAPSKPARPR